MPHLTLIFDLPVDESQRRQERRTSKGQKQDRLDAEDAAFHTRVRDAYLRIAAAEPERVRVIDASGSVQETQALVMRAVMPFLEKVDSRQ
jgi:dTMP kinase